MRSFRTELEDLNNPVVEKDIIELQNKIQQFNEGKIDEEKFRSLRLARGVYGQRQLGVQMVRIKIPYGKLTQKQVNRIADISVEYGGGNLHATTRQDIQIHYVKLDRSPELWAELEKDKITLREACGNTVRNITASAEAGIDPNEAFDASPYAHAFFEYFLRNPICQEMGRKFKVAFSSSDSDTAYTYIHDIGYIPKIKVVDGKEVRGFKVVIGGGLGANPFVAETAYEFLEADKIIPFAEAMLRIFDRHGERARRMKARFKFLFKDLGMEAVMKLVEEEWKALKNKSFPIDGSVEAPVLPAAADFSGITPTDADAFDKWKATNVFAQKQDGFFGVWVRLPLGDMKADRAKKFAAVAVKHAADDIRVTVNQGYLLRYVKEEALASLYNGLAELDLVAPGFDSTTDITACPGTDSCNLGISSSTGMALELERVMKEEYPDIIHNNDIKIKISGCPNACGQHTLAQIGFHGSSLKNGSLVLPAIQVLLGGSPLGAGEGKVADKVIKIPSKRGSDALRYLLEDYFQNAEEGEYYASYYERKGKMYFYELLKPLATLDTIIDEDYIDWGQEDKFEVFKAVGECAGVIIDLVATLLYETEEKYGWAQESLTEESYADAIYHSYNVFVNGAKALLLNTEAKVNTQAGIIADFDKIYVESGDFSFPQGSFKDHVLQINQNEPSKEFAEAYIKEARAFLDALSAHREKNGDPTAQAKPKAAAKKPKPRLARAK